ncbi:MAG: PorT family protein [Prevotella sp.]|nr:PorT family protein [Prevotella sp.]
MKKIIMMAVMAMMVVTNAKAQYEPGTWSLKPTAGLGISYMTNMESISMGHSDLDSQVTFAARSDIEVEYQATNFLGIEAGVTYTMQGGGWENYKNDGVKIEDSRFQLQYIQVPIVANIYVAKGLALKTGVQLGFMTDADFMFTYKSKVEGYDATIDTTVDLKKECNKFDVAIPIGISYEFKNHWVIDARYNLGLSKVNKESVSGEKDSKNGAVFVSLGYKFAL